VGNIPRKAAAELREIKQDRLHNGL
jgi:hypothetical protein